MKLILKHVTNFGLVRYTRIHKHAYIYIYIYIYIYTHTHTHTHAGIGLIRDLSENELCVSTACQDLEDIFNFLKTMKKFNLTV